MNKAKENESNRPTEDSSVPTASFPDIIKACGGKIGPYKLLSVLGEGGFGIVYLAEQKKPVRRQVALKIIKPGMDSKQVIGRFEAERQALALLEHPNIAHVFDGGTTRNGRPYFVMEYVNGKSLTAHCDSKKLNIEDRLRLFLHVCEAVQYAHQKGIIHRDIKPSNILVAIQEDMVTPKVIDFGVAKAISQPLTERTLFTNQGQLIGTPEYMSPEQAERTSYAVDTRSDIYSLGVVLYELLTGVLPFEPGRLRQAAIDDMLRTIRDEEPPRPSTRLSSLGDEAEKVAQNRRTAVRTLTKRLHHELEWIPLKAMRKEPDRRYRTATELADDIRHYLKGDALIAGPESMAYQLKKLISRHKYASSVLGLLLIIILSFCYTSFDLYLTAKEAKNHSDKTVKAMTRQAAEYAIFTRQIAFTLFLQAWQQDKPKQAMEISNFILGDGGNPEAAALRLILDRRSLTEKEPEIKEAFSEYPGFAEFLIGEHYLKNGDTENALRMYAKSYSILNGEGSQLKERRWFVGQLRARIDELNEPPKPKD